MLFNFFLKLFVSFLFGASKVCKNRGQLLERPEWKVIPELAGCLGIFTLFFLGSCVLPFFSHDIKNLNFLEIATLLLVVVIIVSGFTLNKFISNKLILSKKEDKNANNLEENLKDKKEYHKEVFGYLSYTIIYMSVVFLVFFLLEFFLLNLIPSDYLQNIYRLVGVNEKKNIFQWGVTEMRLVGIIGAAFTLCQMIENFRFSREKIQKDRILNIKEYLAESSVKN